MRTLNTHVCDCVDKVNANPKRVQSLYKASTHIDKERIERVLVLESPHLSIAMVTIIDFISSIGDASIRMRMRMLLLFFHTLFHLSIFHGVWYFFCQSHESRTVKKLKEK